ncbi:MAG: ArsR/SmtB family transcription factor [Alphaproteobacteria bacterium]
MQSNTATASHNCCEPHDNTTAAELAALAKALAHPARIEILRILARRQSCIGCDIVEEIGLAQSTTSEHLRILKAAGLIVGEVERPRVCYSLNPTALEPLQHFIAQIGTGKDRKSTHVHF